LDEDNSILTYILVFLSQYSEIGYANISSLYLFIIVLYLFGGRVSWVDVAARYGLGGPGIEPRCEHFFPTHPDRPRVQPSFLYNGCQVSFLEVKLPGPVFDHLTHIWRRS